MNMHVNILLLLEGDSSFHHKSSAPMPKCLASKKYSVNIC